MRVSDILKFNAKDAKRLAIENNESVQKILVKIKAAASTGKARILSEEVEVTDEVSALLCGMGYWIGNNRGKNITITW